MALPGGLPLNSDLGSSFSQLGYNLVDASTTIAVPYTLISGRAQIPDISKNLKVSFGVDRHMTQNLVPVMGEYGPNGEQVFTHPNDVSGMVRFVGNWVSSQSFDGSYGFYPSANNAGDFIEITFYGTGLNILSALDYGRDVRVSIDNGAEGANILPPSNGAQILAGRNYAINTPLNVASGLTLGIHTVRLTVKSATFTSLGVYGYEVLNTNSSTNIVVNPGSVFNSGQRISLASQVVTPYNSNFDSGTLGSRGGRVSVYLKQNGTVGKAVTPTNTSVAYLNSADHTNEDIARVFHFREFGSGRSDDYSTLINATSVRGFTLDDGTTTLTGNSSIVTTPAGTVESVRSSGSNTVMTFNFIGTGLDVITAPNDPNARLTIVTVDGQSAGTITTAANEVGKRQPIVSGLPYGSHTVKLTQSGSFDTVFIRQFVVYQPKNPTIPTGAVELANYNIMANYSSNTQFNTNMYMSTGVLRKACQREILYVEGTGGTSNWTLIGGQSGYATGPAAATNRNGAYYEYTFYGTGVDLRCQTYAAATSNATILVDGLALTSANFSGVTINTNGTNMTYGGTSGSNFALPASNVWSLTWAGGTTDGQLSIMGLPLGVHKIRVTNNTTGELLLVGIDVITPVHSYKANGHVIYQNTYNVGSQSIGDSRKTFRTAFAKNYSIASGVTSGPSGGTNGINKPLEEMTTVHTNRTGRVRVYFSNTYQSATTNSQAEHKIVVDGVIQTPTSYPQNTAPGGATATMSMVIPVTPGTHKYDVVWLGNGNTNTANNKSRILLVEEVD